ncbi:MAG: FkbM family methyltransferase [Fibrobacteria bacterium]|nr:FkbM family methyltransferase [Fibrobacteria bacterium]
MRITTCESIGDLAARLGFTAIGKIFEEDIDVVETNCDWFERKRRDAEVLGTVAANTVGDILELGTSFGRGTSELALNLAGRGDVHTVNILPEQANSDSGKLVTHFLGREQIGSYYRSKGATNVVQIFADTSTWVPEPQLERRFGAVFIDAAHDEENVFKDSLLVSRLLRNGGLLLWHDFNPSRRFEMDWIDSVMKGVERFAAVQGGDFEVLHLRNSWIGIARWTPKDGTGSPASGVETSKRPSLGEDRFLVGYSNYPYPSDVGATNEAWLGRLRGLGHSVEGICLTIDPPGPCLMWEELDRAWNARDPKLMALYERILRRISETGATIFVNYNGINLHPQFVEELKKVCTTVYCCFDDPESSHILSRPVAAWYDVAMVGNIAELDMYRNWGCRHVEWLPIGFRADEVDPTMSERRILESSRSVELSIFCERLSPWRRERLDRIASEFPRGIFRGPGWSDGFVSEADKIRVMADTRIGFNLHNSTGPINYRTFTVPANGAMLLCDNSTQLGKVFELGVEAVGYDYMDEAVFDARFFLANETRRREIAAAGWVRTMRDYSEDACFRRISRAVNEARAKRQQLNRAISAKPGNLQSVRVQHLNWELDPARYIDREILTHGVFEQGTTDILRSLVRPGMRWMDVGANIGYYTMLLSTWATREGKGWAWEPTPHLAAHLRRHAEINGVGDRFTLHERGLGESKETLRIGFDSVSATLHWPTTAGPANTVGIEIVPLDSEEELAAEAGIDVLKIDIDGHEPFFFRGAREFFKTHRPFIAMEFANLNLTVAGESVYTLVEELNRIGYVPISEKTLEPYPDPLTFLVECGNFAFSANAWAVPAEILEDLGTFRKAMDRLPRSMVDELRVFASARDYLLWANVAPGLERTVRLRALGGSEVVIRGGTSDATVVWDAFHYKYHVPPVTLAEGAFILDLGANIGLTAAEMGHSNPGSRILSVELDAENAVQARKNTAFLGTRCEVVQAGIWTEDGTIQYGGESRQGFAIEKSSQGGRSAPSRRVASLLSERGIERVDYVKMDIEGAELAVLEDAGDWMPKVRSIKVELHHMEEFDRIWTLLEGYGFRCAKEPKHYCSIEGVRA